MSASPKTASNAPVVVLDPGHGGKHPGGVAHGIQEKEVNLQLALKVAPSLEAAGIKVIFTREEDVEVSLVHPGHWDKNTAADEAYQAFHQSFFMRLSDITALLF